MRRLPKLFLSVALATMAASALAQNAPAANAKPAEQKPAAEAKAADGKTSPKADPKAASNKGADTKAAAKSADGKADPKTADTATPANEKDTRKSAKGDSPLCVVAEFRALGIDVHDPVKRRTQAMGWLKKRAKNCSVDQLLMIRNNRSQWMGTADSAAMAAEVDSLLEVYAADNPQVAALLYGTVPPPADGQAGK